MLSKQVENICMKIKAQIARLGVKRKTGNGFRRRKLEVFGPDVIDALVELQSLEIPVLLDRHVNE